MDNGRESHKNELFSMKPFLVSREQLIALTITPKEKYPKVPDFWRYGNRNYYEKKYPERYNLTNQKTTLKSFRKDMEAWLSKLIDGLSDSDRVLVNSSVGTGKTTTIAKVLNQRDFKQAWFVETQEGADELGKHHFPGRKTVVLRSRRKLNEKEGFRCDFLKFFDEYHPRAIDTICTNPDVCGKWDNDCDYAKRRKQAFASETEILILPHAYLGIPAIMRKVHAKRFDIVVIDENFLLSSAREMKIPRLSIVEYKELLEEQCDDLKFTDSKAFTSLAIDLCNQLLKRDAPDNYFRCESPCNIDVSKEIEGLIKRECKTVFEKNQRFVSDLSDLIQTISANYESIVFWWENDKLRFVQKAELPDDIPCLFLDAAGDPRSYDQILNTRVSGRDLEVIFKVKQTAKIIQFKDGHYGKTTFFGRNVSEDEMETPVFSDEGSKTFARMLSLVKTIEKSLGNKDNRIALITHKHLEEHIRPFLKNNCPAFHLLSDEDKAYGSRDDVEHYYNLRGTNTYKEHSVLIVIGTPFIPPEATVKAMRRLYDIYNKEELRLIREVYDDRAGTHKSGSDKVQYRDRDYETVDAFSHNDVRVQSIYEMRVLNEIYQAIGRIRPYRDLKKGEEVTVYLVTNVPIRWYEVEKPRIMINDFLSKSTTTGLSGIRKDVVEKLKRIASVVSKMPPSFQSAVFFDEYEKHYGKQSTGKRETLRALMMKHSKLLKLIPPEGKKRTFKRKGKPLKDLFD